MDNETQKKQIGRPIDIDARADRRKQILDGARNCFAQKGFHPTNMQQIAQIAKVSSANIYQYFKSKDEMIIALIEEDLKSDIEIIKEISNANSFKDGLSLVVEKFSKDDGLFKIMQLRLEVLAEGLRNEHVAKVLVKSELETIDALAKTIEVAQNRGEISKNIIPQDAALIILSSADGVLSRLFMNVKTKEEIGTSFIRFIGSALGFK